MTNDDDADDDDFPRYNYLNEGDNNLDDFCILMKMMMVVAMVFYDLFCRMKMEVAKLIIYYYQVNDDCDG